MSKVSVAVIGLNGALGAPVIEAFKSPAFKQKFAFPVLALTRDASSKESCETIKYVSADITGDKESVIKELSSIDVIVSLVKPTPETLAGIEDLLLQVKPKLYIPSQFGCDIAQADTVFPGFLSIKTQHSQKVRDSGVKVVDIVTSLFAGGPWLYEIVGHVGIDVEAKTVHYLGLPETSFSFTHLKDVGRVVVSVASQANQKLPDLVRVHSGRITAGDVATRYETSRRIKLMVRATLKEKVLREAQSSWNPADYSRFPYLLNVLISQGEEKGVCFTTTDNELVNPGESLWTWERY